MNPNEETIDLSRFFHVMRTRWKIIVGIIFTCTVIAAAIAFSLPKQYESTSLLEVVGTREENMEEAVTRIATYGINSGSLDVLRSTCMELLKSRAVLDPVIDCMGYAPSERPDAKAFEKQHLQIRNLKATTLIEVVARAHTPEEAQGISQRVVEQFLLRQRERNVSLGKDENDIGIRLVDAANLPDVRTPAAPRKRLIASIGFAVGILLSIGYSLAIYKREE